ncbi:MAG: carbamoyltransferase N-terminal domain-containing protein [Sumerlaeia bacterium]
MSPRPPYTLGLSALYHDSAAALVGPGGEVLAAAHEERFTRRRHDAAFPREAIAYCLAEAGIGPTDLSAIVFYEKPFTKFLDRFLINHIAEWPRSLAPFLEAVPSWMGEKFWLPYELAKAGLFRVPVRYVTHHESHAASAFLPSPFEQAAIVTCDGVGEWSTTTVGFGEGDDFVLTQEVRFPHSLGLLYSTMTAYLGFRVNSAEYKVMGLAPYGEPTMVDKFRKLCHLHADGSFHLDMRYFRFHRSLRMPTRALEELFGAPCRRGEDEPLTQFHKDCARSLQEFTNEAMLGLARRAHASFPGTKNLVMAGGVALNCVSNSYILEHGPFDNIWVQPAAGDAGGAVGGALMVAREIDPDFRRHEMAHVALGPAFGDAAIREAMEEQGLPYREMASDEELIEYLADRLVEQAIVGWFQGRMEYGPRALGNRSILADPRAPENRDRVNLAIKFRESFRPFAPAVPEDAVGDWFDWRGPSRFMLFTATTREPERLPAIAHVDASARLQTVTREHTPLYYDLHRAFERRTGVPVLINTSFNVRGEPIVCTPRDAVATFLGTHIDVLAMGRFVAEKREVPREALRVEAHRTAFKPD